jgi:hypothetical protein
MGGIARPLPAELLRQRARRPHRRRQWRLEKAPAYGRRAATAHRGSRKEARARSPSPSISSSAPTPSPIESTRTELEQGAQREQTARRPTNGLAHAMLPPRYTRALHALRDTSSFWTGHRLRQNYCNIWMAERSRCLFRRLLILVSETEVGAFGNE